MPLDEYNEHEFMDHVFKILTHVRNRFALEYDFIFKFKIWGSGVPTREISIIVEETTHRRDALCLKRILNVNSLREYTNLESYFAVVLKSMVDDLIIERKKRDMDVTINPAVIKGTVDISTGTYFNNKSTIEFLQEKIQKIVEDYIIVLNEEHEDMGEFYYEHRESGKDPHMLHCRAKDFKWGSFGTSFGASAFEENYTRNEMDNAVSHIQKQINEHHARIASGKSNYWKVIFNPPATIVLWGDGSKTVVKCGKNEKFDPEKGLAMCIAKKVLGNRGNYYELFKEWVPKEKPFFVRADGYVDCPVIISQEEGVLEE